MKIGVVLSGGGIRGIAHFGVLKALKESHIEISMITGTSAGAIVGALYANGISPDEAFKIFQGTRFLSFLRPAFRGPALLNLETAIPLFKKYIPHDSFENLNIPLVVTATNFNKGELVYFDKGDLIRKVLASSCIPGVFSPIMIDGQFYVDGGVLNNFPVEPLLTQCDYVLGSSCNNLPQVDKFKNIKQVLERAAVLSINSDMKEKLKYVDFLIEPLGLGKTSIFEIKKAEEIFWLAYEETLNQISSIKEQIKLKTI
jgi:NTE family protein